MLIFLPSILFALATKEIFRWNRLQVLDALLVAFAYLAPIVSHINVVYNVLPGIRDGLVDSIQSIEDLNKLQAWLNLFWSPRKWLAFMTWVGLFFGILITVGFSLSFGNFIGVGLTIATMSVIPFFVIPLLVISHMLTLPSQLASYHLNLYESDPANSEVIQRLINILNVYIYILAGYVAVSTALSSLEPAWNWFVVVIMFIGWAPTIMQFIINQYAVRKMIITAKWRNLNRLQSQIRELQNNDLIDAPEKAITRLNQLMLPLLGLLLGNIDKLVKLLAPAP